MDLSLRQKVALVAAASKGLGKAVARELAGEGARVAICSRDENLVRQAADEIAAETGSEVYAQRADVTQPEHVKRFVSGALDRFGTAHILVTNAGGPRSAVFEGLEDSDWENAFQLNLMSVIGLCRLVIPHMQKNRWGRIINLTSVSVKQPVEGLMLSNSIRSAVIGFAKTLANELAPHNILVNNVCPGYILTDRVDELSKATASRKGTTRDEVLHGWEATIPLGRLGQPRELAALVAFLASERASYITGATIQVDGGLIRGMM